MEIPHDELPHRRNILAKKVSRKYSSEEPQALLAEIEPKEEEWHQANAALTECTYVVVEERVAIFNTYKDFLDQRRYAEGFDSRSRLHSSALEQFCYYLLKDAVREVLEGAREAGIDPVAPLVGDGTKTFEDMHFAPSSFRDMLAKPLLKLKVKDHDFIIGQNVMAVIANIGPDDSILGGDDPEQRSQLLHLRIPAVLIECKTYLDKTMLDNAAYAAERLKASNPHCLFVIVSEFLKLDAEENPRMTKIDEIYVLRRQRNTDREFRLLEGFEKKPIQADLAWDLFRTVREHLWIEWGTGSGALERGKLVGLSVAEPPQDDERGSGVKPSPPSLNSS